MRLVKLTKVDPDGLDETGNPKPAYRTLYVNPERVMALAATTRAIAPGGTDIWFSDRAGEATVREPLDKIAGALTDSGYVESVDE